MINNDKLKKIQELLSQETVDNISTEDDAFRAVKQAIKDSPGVVFAVPPHIARILRSRGVKKR